MKNKKRDLSRKHSGNERKHREQYDEEPDYDLESGDNPDERERIFPTRK